MTSFTDFFKELADRYPAPAPEDPEHTVTPFPKCSSCHEFPVSDYGLECEQCRREKAHGYEALQLLGRLANGFQSDMGKLFHAVPFGSQKAMCGAHPSGRHSVGWTFDPQGHGKQVTCPRCLARINKSK